MSAVSSALRTPSIDWPLGDEPTTRGSITGSVSSGFMVLVFPNENARERELRAQIHGLERCILQFRNHVKRQTGPGLGRPGERQVWGAFRTVRTVAGDGKFSPIPVIGLANGPLFTAGKAGVPTLPGESPWI